MLAPNNSFNSDLLFPVLQSQPVRLFVEAVEKANLARIPRVGRKCNPSGCSIYDDLLLERVKRPRKLPLNRSEGVFLQAR
jgi:hypothetical protein